MASRWVKEGSKVALISRTQSKIQSLAQEVGSGCEGFAADCTDMNDMKRVVGEVENSFGATVDTLIYNAGNGVWGEYDKIDMQKFDQAMHTNVHGLLIATKLLAPKMVSAGGGVIGVTGATASLRGKPFTTGFAPAKGAQRLLAQSLARDLGPKGVHVFLGIIDGAVYSEEAAKAQQDMAYERFVQPDAIADTYWYLANQHPSAWSFEVDVRSNVSEW